MCADPDRWNVGAFQKPDHVLAGDVQHIRGLLSGQFLITRQDSDARAVGHHTRRRLKDNHHGLRQIDGLASVAAHGEARGAAAMTGQ